MIAHTELVRIFHIVDRNTWAAAVGAGEYRPPSLAGEGFVHFSFAEQVAGTANALYREKPDLVVVEIECADLPHTVRIEDSYGSGVDFPHVYGPIPTTAAVTVHELTRDANGDWTFSPGGSGASSTDR